MCVICKYKYRYKQKWSFELGLSKVGKFRRKLPVTQDAIFGKATAYRLEMCHYSNYVTYI